MIRSLVSRIISVGLSSIGPAGVMCPMASCSYAHRCVQCIQATMQHANRQVLFSRCFYTPGSHHKPQGWRSYGPWSAHSHAAGEVQCVHLSHKHTAQEVAQRSSPVKWHTIAKPLKSTCSKGLWCELLGQGAKSYATYNMLIHVFCKLRPQPLHHTNVRLPNQKHSKTAIEIILHL